MHEATSGQGHARMLAEHRRLRWRLFELQELASINAVDAGRFGELRTCLRTLVTELEFHVDSEEESLEPTEAPDVWGFYRAASIKGDHTKSIARLAAVLAELDHDFDPLIVALELDGLVAQLLRDFAEQEQAMSQRPQALESEQLFDAP